MSHASAMTAVAALGNGITAEAAAAYALGYVAGASSSSSSSSSAAAAAAAPSDVSSTGSTGSTSSSSSAASAPLPAILLQPHFTTMITTASYIPGVMVLYHTLKRFSAYVQQNSPHTIHTSVFVWLLVNSRTLVGDAPSHQTRGTKHRTNALSKLHSTLIHCMLAFSLTLSLTHTFLSLSLSLALTLALQIHTRTQTHAHKHTHTHIHIHIDDLHARFLRYPLVVYTTSQLDIPASSNSDPPSASSTVHSFC